MDRIQQLRDELVFQLTKGNAHMTFEEAVADFPEEKINATFPNNDYTFWHLLEHIRRTQADILDFSKNPDYEEREWPKDYWPEKHTQATQQNWDETIQGYLKNRDALVHLIQNKQNDLFAPIPWGSGQTLMREVLVVSDHTSYHIGEFAIMRQILNVWGGGQH